MACRNRYYEGTEDGHLRGELVEWKTESLREQLSTGKGLSSERQKV
jgi:hypothetical protein